MAAKASMIGHRDLASTRAGPTARPPALGDADKLSNPPPPPSFDEFLLRLSKLGDDYRAQVPPSQPPTTFTFVFTHI